MADFNNMLITTKGKVLYAKAQAGKQLKFTKLMAGSGDVGTQNPETLVALVKPKYDFGIQSITPNPELKTATISCMLNNSNIEEAAYICEMGLFAEDPDEGEILYAYTNAGKYGDYMAPASQGPYSWNYQINAAIGNAANVTVELSNLTYDYGVINTNTTFSHLKGGNQKEINKCIDTIIKDILINIPDISDIKNWNDKVDKVDYVRAHGYGETTGTSKDYVVSTSPAPTNYNNGMQITIIPHIDCVANPTLNWSGLGALKIVNQDGSAINAGDIKENNPLNLVRIGSFFFISSSKKKNIYDKMFGNNLCKYFGANMPSGKIRAACSEYNGKIYVIGGYQGYIKWGDWNGSGPSGLYDNTLDSLEIFDIKSNTWTLGTKLPISLESCSSCAYNGKIYVFSGQHGCADISKTFCKSLYIYDILSNTWSKNPTPIPYVIGSNSAIPSCNLLYNDKIYIFGGQQGYLMYDITLNTYSDIIAPKETKTCAAYSLYNGKIYIISDSTTKGNGNPESQIYDILTNTWSYFNMSYDNSQYSGSVCGIYNDKLFIVGGDCQGLYNDHIEICDINTGNYLLNGGNIYPPRRDAISCVVGDKIFFMGGQYMIPVFNAPAASVMTNRVDIIDMNI